MMRALLIAALLFSTNAFAAEITIKRADGENIIFNVERATDDASRAKGLMFREKLDDNAGMLFVYPKPSRIAFWMKNTLIPLDMLFFDAQGQLVYLHPKATPHDLTPIGPERSDICAVLEIGGGMAASRGLKAGDRLVLSDHSACLP